MKKRIGILTGGGDAPGLNPAIKWATKKGLSLGYEVFGIIDGWKGILELGEFSNLRINNLYKNAQSKLESSAIDFIRKGIHEIKWKDLVKNAGISIAPLTEKDVSKWDELPGSEIGNSRINPFKIDNDRSEVLLKNIENLGLDFIVAMGGEDTLGAAHKAYQLGIKTIGIPKTIDGDLLGSDYTLGFRTAVDVIRNTVLNLHGTAKSHDQSTIVETMGRHSGVLAHTGGKVSGADMILIPEYSPSLEQIADILTARRKKKINYDMIIISEGTKIKDYGGYVTSGDKDEFDHVALGGIGNLLKNDLGKMTHQKMRVKVLGHQQRGTIPNGYDVEKGIQFGIAAVELIELGESGKMVSYRDGKIKHVSLEEVSKGTKNIDINKMYDIKKLNVPFKSFGI